jgi:hypothetical protein
MAWGVRPQKLRGQVFILHSPIKSVKNEDLTLCPPPIHPNGNVTNGNKQLKYRPVTRVGYIFMDVAILLLFWNFLTFYL